MELLSFTFAAGEVKRWERAGRYIEVIDAPYSFDLFLYDRNGGRVDEAKSALSGIYLEGAYAAVELKSTSAQTITLLVTDGRGGSRRQPGNVRVIDQSADKTANGSQFLGNAPKPAVVGKVSIAQMQAGSKRLAVRKITCSSTIAGSVQFGFATGFPATNAGIGGLINKNAGGAVSNSARYIGEGTNVPLTTADMAGLVTLATMQVAANVETTILDMTQTPLIVQPGGIIWVSGNALNRDISATFDVEEL